MRIVYTAIPAGFVANDRGHVKVTVAIGFTANRGGDTPDDVKPLHNWPAELPKFLSRLELQITNGAKNDKYPCVPEMYSLDALDRQAWAKLVWGVDANATPQRVTLAQNKTFTERAHFVVPLFNSLLDKAGSLYLQSAFIRNFLESKAVFSGEDKTKIQRGIHHELTELHNFNIFDDDVLSAKTNTFQSLSKLAADLPKRKTLDDHLIAERKAIDERNYERLKIAPLGSPSSERDQSIARIVETLMDYPEVVVDDHSAFSANAANSLLAAMVDCELFHRRIPKVATNAHTDELDPNREQDVFERVSLLRNYPALLKPLGLVLDIILPSSYFAQGEGRILIYQKGDDSALRETVFEFEQSMGVFAPKSKGNIICGGFLNLEDPQFEIISCEADGLMKKLTIAAIADSAEKKLGREPANAPTTPRSGGVSLIWKNRIKRLHATVNAQAGTDPDRRPLYAEDLILGYIPEIQVPGEPWRSLTTRQEYFLDARRYDGCRYGVVRAATTKTLDQKYNQTPGQLTDIHAADMVFTWPGWSLTAPEIESPDFLPTDFRLSHLTKSPKWPWLQNLLASESGANGAIDGLCEEINLLIWKRLLKDGFAEIKDTLEPEDLLRVELALQDRSDEFRRAWANRIILEALFPQGIVRRRGGSAGSMEDTQTANTTDRTGHRWRLKTHIEAAKNSLPSLRFAQLCETEPSRMRVRVVDLGGNYVKDEDVPATAPTKSFCYRRYEPLGAPALLLGRAPKRTGEDLTPGLQRMVIHEDARTDVRWVVPPRVSERFAELHGLLDDPDLDSAGSFRDCEMDATGDFPMVAEEGSQTENPRGTVDGAPIRRSSIKSPEIAYYPDPLAQALIWSIEFGVVKAKTDDKVIKIQTIPKTIPFYQEQRWPFARAIKIILESTLGARPHGRWDTARRALVIGLPKGSLARLHLRCYPHKGSWNPEVFGPFALYYLHGRNPDVTANAGRVSGAYSIAWNDLMAGSRSIELIHAARKPQADPELFMSLSEEVFQRFEGKSEAKIQFNANLDQASAGKLRLEARWSSAEIPGGPIMHTSGVVTEQKVPEALLMPGLLRLWDKRSSPPVEFSSLTAGFHVVSFTPVAVSRFKDFPSEDSPSALDYERPGMERRVPFLSVVRPNAPIISEVHYLDELEQKTEEKNDVISGRHFISDHCCWLRVFLSRDSKATGNDELAAVLLSPDPRVGLNPDLATSWGIDPLRTFAPSQQHMQAMGPSQEHLEGFAVVTPGDIIDLPQVARILTEENSYARSVRAKLRLAPELYAALRDVPKDTSRQKDQEVRGAVADWLDWAVREGYVRGEDWAARRSWLRTLFNSRTRNGQIVRAFMPESLIDKNQFKEFPLPQPPGAANQTRVLAVPFRLRMEPGEEGRPYFDIRFAQLPAERTYVRLAVAIFQPHSANGLQLSSPVLVDFAQPVPDRKIVIWRNLQAWRENVLEIRIYRNKLSPMTRQGTPKIRVLKEERSGGWVPAPEVEWTERACAADSEVILEGSLTWKKPVAPARLMIYETFRPFQSTVIEQDLPERVIDIIQL